MQDVRWIPFSCETKPDTHVLNDELGQHVLWVEHEVFILRGTVPVAVIVVITTDWWWPW